jgi:hypothetical protein
VSGIGFTVVSHVTSFGRGNEERSFVPSDPICCRFTNSFQRRRHSVEGSSARVIEARTQAQHARRKARPCQPSGAIAFKRNR